MLSGVTFQLDHVRRSQKSHPSEGEEKSFLITITNGNNVLYTIGTFSSFEPMEPYHQNSRDCELLLDSLLGFQSLILLIFTPSLASIIDYYLSLLTVTVLLSTKTNLSSFRGLVRVICNVH